MIAIMPAYDNVSTPPAFTFRLPHLFLTFAAVKDDGILAKATTLEMKPLVPLVASGT